jgi:hypothetical protein
MLRSYSLAVGDSHLQVSAIVAALKHIEFVEIGYAAGVCWEIETSTTIKNIKGIN